MIALCTLAAGLALGLALGFLAAAAATARAAAAYAAGERPGRAVAPLVKPLVAGHARRQAAIARALGGPRLVREAPPLSRPLPRPRSRSS